MTVEYPDLTDVLAIAAAVTGTDLRTLSRATRLDLAGSALHAPSASFGDEEFYPDFVDKAAVLLVRVARNPPSARRQQARCMGDAPALHRDERLGMGGVSIGG